MILSVSQRSDIVAFYIEWFMKRYHEGFWDVRNPYYPQQISRIKRSAVDMIYFCTKNPIPILSYLDEIEEPIVFNVTLTPYGKEIEPTVIDKRKIIEAIKVLSKKVGKENVYVRYDPIFLSEKYTLEYHIRVFTRMCTLLDGFISYIIVSFLDDYKNVRNNQQVLKTRKFEEEDYRKIGKNFAQIAKEHGMSVQTCCEQQRLLEYGFIKQDCMSNELAYKMTGKTYKKWTARQSRDCSCVGFVDIGVYNSCLHFCKYCYANYDENKVEKNYSFHKVDSTLLVGVVEAQEEVKIRK
jgi:Domain of unknown function (DUF1848).